ncbi:MAG: dTDP-4-dehydrorhamnose reductase [Phycisphaerales bacterium]|nr:MAG: dTDP-4-dehydrorhamnose reductase [Phycisphaerales bacterium]
MRVLVIGKSGMLARALAGELTHRRVAFEVVGRPEVDLSKPSTIPGGFAGFTHVINASAWTDVDGAETHEREATVVNGESVGVLARACAASDTTLVHYSTDYVFNGRANTPYSIDTPRDPVSAYGRSKAKGEASLQETHSLAPRWLCLRTSWLYAPWGKNFTRTIARASRERDALKVVIDQRGRPSSCLTLARTTLDLLEKNATGMLHACDAGECTWFEFAKEIVRLAGREGTCRVDPCTTDEFPRPARRPAYSVLDLAPTEALVGPMTPWREALAEVFARLEA